MAVMCRLVRGPVCHGNAKVLVAHILKRRETVSVSGRARTDQLVSGMKSKSGHAMEQSFQPYIEMLNRRKDEAKRTILVEVQGLTESGGFRKFCEEFGPINACYMYKTPAKNFVLVEFKHEASKINAVNHALHSKDPQSIPLTSPLLFYHQSGKVLSPPLPDRTQEIKYDEEALIGKLPNLPCHVDERLKTEMAFLCKNSQISDLSLRLRFFTCHQLDTALSGLCSGARALPFGSSVSGFGRNTGDLDIYLHFKKKLKEGSGSTKSELFYQSKTWLRDKNLQLKLIGDIISVLLPGCTNVISILSARVPIIKYFQTLSNLECDLQNCSASGVDLSHILYLMHHWDPRVAPLVYSIRLWASRNNICSLKKPSPTVTNFSMMLMVLFYLQIKKVLPSLQSFQEFPDHITSPSMDPSSAIVFPDLRKVKKSTLTGSNSEGIDSLLFGFFEYYSKFDFQKNQISIYLGKTVSKSAKVSLQIENPVNPFLNVSANVSSAGLGLFTKAAKAACNILNEDYANKSITIILKHNDGIAIEESRPLALEKKKKQLT